MSVCAVHALALGLLLEEASAQLAENVQYRPGEMQGPRITIL